MDGREDRQGSESLNVSELENLSWVLGTIRLSEWNSQEDKITENNIIFYIILLFSIFEVGQRCIPMCEDTDFQGMNKFKLSI